MNTNQDNFPFDVPPPGKPITRQRPPSEHTTIRSLTRLVVGGMLWGTDRLLNNLVNWEARSSETKGSQSSNGINTDEESPPEIVYEYAPAFLQARNLIVGAIFVAQDRILSGIDQVFAQQQAWGNRLFTRLKPLSQNPLNQPISDRFEMLVARGKREVDQLVSVGERETTRSQALAQTAIDSTVNSYIEDLAENPEVQELVQSQSTGLADEAVEEFRERAVSADNLIEGFVRYFFRRLPRTELPPPPPEVKKRARRVRPEQGKKQ